MDRHRPLSFSRLASEKTTLLSCWGIAAVIALNVLTKGLIGVVFPAPSSSSFSVARDLRHLLKMHLVSSTIVFLLIAAPWHILAAIANPPPARPKVSSVLLVTSSSSVISAALSRRLRHRSHPSFYG